MRTVKLLVVEDDESIRDMLGILLESRGFSQVELVASGEAALEIAAKTTFDLVLLDLTLPGVDGLDVCRYLRTSELNSRVPVVILTARGEESDVVAGLESGAVDYVVKPFNNGTLIARIRAHLRRTQELTTEADATENVPNIERDGVLIFPNERTVRVDGQAVELTFTEYELLLLLIQSPGRVWSRREIALKIRGDEYVAFDRAIDVQIANLRKKLGRIGAKIETARGVGYRWKRS